MQSEKFTVKFAETEQEKNAAYALRYRDMLKEYNPELPEEGLDITEADGYARQIICVDNETGEVVGCYRIITSNTIPEGAKFVCEDEFDISALRATGEGMAELSRAVVKKEYRNSIVLMLLLRFIAKYLRGEASIRFIIGEASFFGTDKREFAKELSYLAHYHAGKEFPIASLDKEQIELLPKEDLDVASLKRSLPPLIRAYLGFGATVSAESFTDWEFCSVDVFILVDFEHYNVAYVDRILRL